MTKIKTMKATAIPWAEWISRSVNHFAISPQQFWALSLKEWQSLHWNMNDNNAALNEDDLQKLMAMFPDQKTGD